MCLDCKMKDDGLILHVEIYEISGIKDYFFFLFLFFEYIQLPTQNRGAKAAYVGCMYTKYAIVTHHTI